MSLRRPVVLASLATALVAGASPALAAEGSSVTYYAPTTTSVATTLGQETNRLVLYTQPGKADAVDTFAQVRLGTAGQDSLRGRMSMVVCDVDGRCAAGASTGFSARYSAEGNESPANWFPTARTASGRPLRSVTLHVQLDAAYLTAAGQPADVAVSLP